MAKRDKLLDKALNELYEELHGLLQQITTEVRAMRDLRHHPMSQDTLKRVACMLTDAATVAAIINIPSQANSAAMSVINHAFGITTDRFGRVSFDQDSALYRLILDKSKEQMHAMVEKALESANSKNIGKYSTASLRCRLERVVDQSIDEAVNNAAKMVLDQELKKISVSVSELVKSRIGQMDIGKDLTCEELQNPSSTTGATKTMVARNMLEKLG